MRPPPTNRGKTVGGTGIDSDGSAAVTDQQGWYQAVADYGGDGVGFEIVDRLSRAALATVLRLRR